MRMIEKDFYEPAEDGSDLRDPPIEPGPRGAILRRLIEPRPIDVVPTRPLSRPMPTQVRPTAASEAALAAATAACEAAARAKHTQDYTMEAAAAVADATLEHRQADAAAATVLREGRELARRQSEEELDAMIASGDFDDGDGDRSSASQAPAPPTLTLARLARTSRAAVTTRRSRSSTPVAWSSPLTEMRLSLLYDYRTT